MEPQLFCKYCGSIDDYSLINRHGTQIASCNGCGAYIKSMSTPDIAFSFGKFKGVKVSNIFDLDYLHWYLHNISNIKLNLKIEIQKQIRILSKVEEPIKQYMRNPNTVDDEKIAALFLKFGYEGVGLFYSILEKIVAQNKPMKTVALKGQLKVGKKLEECWKYLEEIGLISSHKGETFNIRLPLLDEPEEKPVVEMKVVPITKNRKSGRCMKEIPTVEDVVEYFEENGYSEETARKAFKYYNDNDWYDSRGNKVRSWKQKMVGNWFKAENKTKPAVANTGKVFKFDVA